MGVGIEEVKVVNGGGVKEWKLIGEEWSVGGGKGDYEVLFGKKDKE